MHVNTFSLLSGRVNTNLQKLDLSFLSSIFILKNTSFIEQMRIIEIHIVTISVHSIFNKRFVQIVQTVKP